MIANKQQISQEEEYSFPYHYVTEFESDLFTQSFVDTWGINYVSTIEYILERLGNCNFSSVVDVGCGDGRLTREIAKRFPGKSILGVDYSARAINLAVAMNMDIRDIMFMACDITQPWAEGKRDVAVLMEVLEHIPLQQGDMFIAGVHNLLHPGGTLLLTVPHVNKPVEYKHFRHFSSTSLCDALQSHFDIAEVVPFERDFFTRRLVNALLCNRLFILNNRHILRVIYKYYKASLFLCDREEQCQRLFVRAVAK